MPATDGRRVTSRRGVLKTGAALLACAGCASTHTDTGATLEKRSLTVGAIQSVTASGLYVAQQRGYFAAEGLQVSIVPTTGSGPVMTELLNGRLDINFGNYVSFIIAQAAGVADLRLLAAGSDAVAHEMEIGVGPGSPITSVTMLRGATIGVNALDNVATLLVSSVLAAHGVDASEYTFTAIPFPSMGAALAGRRVGAGLLIEPFLTVDRAKYRIAAIADCDQGATTNFPISGYAVTAAWARKYPKSAAAFVRALARGQRLAGTSRAAVVQALPHYITITPTVARAVVLGDFPTSLDRARIQHVADVMHQFRMLSRPFSVASMIG